MAGMQEIEAAVGEDELAAVAFVAGKPQNRLLQCEDGIQKGLRASAAGTNREAGSCSLSRRCAAARSTRRAGSGSVSDYATSMIGLCQEGKSSPDALGRSAGVNSFLVLRRVCWPLGRGS